jgi:hypothetical protein
MAVIILGKVLGVHVARASICENTGFAHGYFVQIALGWNWPPTSANVVLSDFALNSSQSNACSHECKTWYCANIRQCEIHLRES